MRFLLTEKMLILKLKQTAKRFLLLLKMYLILFQSNSKEHQKLTQTLTNIKKRLNLQEDATERTHKEDRSTDC